MRKVKTKKICARGRRVHAMAVYGENSFAGFPDCHANMPNNALRHPAQKLIEYVKNNATIKNQVQGFLSGTATLSTINLDGTPETLTPILTTATSLVRVENLPNCGSC